MHAIEWTVTYANLIFAIFIKIDKCQWMNVVSSNLTMTLK